MSLFRWKSRENHSKSSNEIRQQLRQGVVNISDDQARNPYTEVQVLSGHTDIVHHLTKIDQDRCVSAGDDNTAIIWDIQTGQKLAVLSLHTRPITCLLVISSDLVREEYAIDNVLLTASSDRVIGIWDIDSGQCLMTITEHSGTVRYLVTIDDLGVFCTGGQDLCVFSHRGQLLHKVARKGEQADIHRLLSIKSNRIVVASGKSLQVYKLNVSDQGEVTHIECLKTLQGHREAIRSLIKISDRSFASGSIDGSIMVWTSHALNPSREFNFKARYEGDSHGYPFSVQDMVTIEERYILAAIGSGFCLYDVIKETCLIEKLGAHYSKIHRIDLMYGGLFIGTCSEDGTIRLWGCPTISCLPSNCGTAQTADNDQSVLVKIMGKHAPGQQDGKAKRFSSPPVFEPTLLGECRGHSGSVCCFQDYGSDGFVSCGMDNLLILWKDGVVQAAKRNDIVRKLLNWNVL